MLDVKTPQEVAIHLASSAERILIVCPAGCRERWGMIVRCTMPGIMAQIVRGIGEGGVSSAARVTITTWEIAEFNEGIHRALLNCRFDALICDCVPLLPDIMALANRTYYIADRTDGIVQRYGRLNRLANG